MRVPTALAMAPGARLFALRADDERLRRALPLTRRLTFLSPSGGSGCSCAAAAVTRVFAARRCAPQLLVDAGEPGDELRRLLGIGDAAWASWPRRQPEREAPQRLSEAFSGLPRCGDFIALLDLKQTGATPGQPTIAQWSGGIEAVSRFPDILVSDLGRRSVAEAGLAAERSHVTCVVTRAERDAVDAGTSLVQLLRRDGHRAVLCVSDLRGDAPAAAIRVLGRTLEAPPVLLPRDTARLNGGAAPEAWRPATHAAVLTLAARLLDATEGLQ